MSASPTPHAEFPLGPFTPTSRTRSCARRATAGSPRASTTPPPWSRTARSCCSTARTPTTSCPTSGSPPATTASTSSGTRSRCSRRREPYEEFGAEDPRVTEIDGTYYMTYTGWDRKSGPSSAWPRPRTCYTWTKHGPMFPDFNTFLPQGNGQDAPVEQGRRDPAGADRRPLPHVLRRGVDLLRVVRRPDPLGAVLQRRAGDGADAAGHVRRVPRRGRAAADHHQQRADPAAAQRRGEEPGRLGALHLRASCSSTPPTRARSWRR